MARHYLRGRQAAFSLIELLIVVGIMILLTAITLPQLKNTLQDNKLREGSRQVNAFFAQARARAAAIGRPCGVYLEVEKVIGTNPSNYGRQCTRMSMCEVPANYTGDSIGAKISLVHQDPMDNTTPPVEINANMFAGDSDIPQRFIYMGDPVNNIVRKWYELDIKTNFGMIIIMDQRGPVNNNVVEPFTIQFLGRGRGPTYQCIRYLNKFYLVWTDVSILPNSNLPLPLLREPFQYAGSTFTVVRQPRKIGVVRELPQGIAIDMCYSGMGVIPAQNPDLVWKNAYLPIDVPKLSHGQEFGIGLNGSDQWIDNGCHKVVVMFSPGGEVRSVFLNSLEISPSSTIYFLVGRTERVGITLFDYGGDDDRNTSNIFDPQSLWISIGRMNGTVSTSDNLPPTFTGPGMVGSAAQRTEFLRRSRLAAREFSLARGQ